MRGANEKGGKKNLTHAMSREEYYVCEKTLNEQVTGDGKLEITRQRTP